MKIDDQGVSVGTLVREMAQAINKYHRAVTNDMEDPEMVRKLEGYKNGILGTMLLIKEKYEP